MRRRTWMAALVGVAIGALVVTGCSKDEAGPTTLVLGDSLTVGAEIGGLGGDGITVDAEEGRTTEEGIAILEDTDLSDYDQVVIALGTNDYTDSAEEYAPKIGRMLDAADGVPVIWVNVDTGTTKLAPAADGVNAALALVEQDAARFTIADWDHYINGRDDADDLRAGDGVHDSSEGYRVRAEWMADVVSD